MSLQYRSEGTFSTAILWRHRKHTFSAHLYNNYYAIRPRYLLDRISWSSSGHMVAVAGFGGGGGRGEGWGLSCFLAESVKLKWE